MVLQLVGWNDFRDDAMIFLILFLIFNVQIVQASSVNYNNTQSIFNQSLYVQPTPVVQLQFPYEIDTDYVTTGITGLSTTGGGTVTQGTGMAFINTTTTSGSTAVLASNARLTYKPGQGLSAVFSALFDSPDANNNQYIGMGNARDGFFFGYNGTSFGILYRTTISGSTVDTWIAQGSWNGDFASSGISLNPQNGNVYRIQYHWLGFGVVKFFIGNPNDGTWILVHSLRFLNGVVDGTAPMITNGSMRLIAVSNNTGTTAQAVSLKTSSMMGAVQGKSSIMNNTRYCATGNQIVTILAPFIENLLTIQNSLTFPTTGGMSNQTMIYPDVLVVQNRSTQTTVLYLILNATPATALTYTSVNSNSVVVSSSTDTTVTGGNTLLSVIIGITTPQPTYINLADMGIRLEPGDTLTVGYSRLAAGGASAFDASLSWTEGC